MTRPIRAALGPVLTSAGALSIDARHRVIEGDELVDRLTAIQRHALRLRDDLGRASSRVRDGRVDLELQEVDLSMCAAETVRHLEPVLRASTCEVVLSARTELRGVWDAMRLEQIVSNAAKYAPAASIEIATADGARTATLTITDHGNGILPADREAMFSSDLERDL